MNDDIEVRWQSVVPLLAVVSCGPTGPPWAEELRRAHEEDVVHFAEALGQPCVDTHNGVLQRFAAFPSAQLGALERAEGLLQVEVRCQFPAPGGEGFLGNLSLLRDGPARDPRHRGQGFHRAGSDYDGQVGWYPSPFGQGRDSITLEVSRPLPVRAGVPAGGHVRVDAHFARR